MNSSDFVLFALQITTLLACALLCGEIMTRFNQPAVLGEMIGGIILGPTVFGALYPDTYLWLFKSSSNVAMARESCTKLGMLFFLFIAGTEININDLKRHGHKATSIGLVGTLIPILAGVAIVYALPRNFWGSSVQTHFLAFALFVGMNLANSANPVIARILMDLKLIKTETGTLIMTATIFDDLINWTLFAVILNNIKSAGPISETLFTNMVWIAGYFIGVSVIGRLIGRYGFHWIKKQVSWPSGFIAVTTVGILVASLVSEKLGIHAFLGAFLFGVALAGGYDDNERNEIRNVISQFALSFFAPLYFVSMGLNANFITHFDFSLVALICLIACISKIGAVMIGAALAGMKMNQQSLAIGFGLNARGATGIILAGVGLEYKVIDERIFVAMVVMALFTSLISGPAMNLLLAKKR